MKNYSFSNSGLFGFRQFQCDASTRIAPKIHGTTRAQSPDSLRFLYAEFTTKSLGTENKYFEKLTSN